MQFPQDSPTHNNICKALVKVLNELGNDSAPLVVPYANNSNELWRIIDPCSKTEPSVLNRHTNDEKNTSQVAPCPATEAFAPNGLILLWDESDKKSIFGIDINRYLNPLTWGLCALQNANFINLKLTILDFNHQPHANNRFYKIVQALDSNKLPFRLITDPCNCVEKCLKSDAPVSKSDAILELLTNEMYAIVTDYWQRDNHHEIANIIGPLILMGNKYADAKQPEEKRNSLALLTLFRYLHLSKTSKEEEQKNPPSPLIPIEEIKKKSLFEDFPVRLLLVDDQVDRGWGNWVSSMVESETNCWVETLNSPKEFLEEFIGLNTINSNPDNRFDLRLPAGKSRSPSAEKETILLLDLRLFSHENANSFVEKLLPHCRHYTGTKEDRFTSMLGERRFAWPGFLSEELDDAETWYKTPKSNLKSDKNDKSDDIPFIVLSLLPRLLALMDFSLPIVLFSSTGQKKILKLLEPYKNIITDFEKPRFTGMETDDIVETTEQAFYSVLKKATEIAQAASKIREIRTLNLTKYNVAKNLFRKKQHIEIFHDESLRPGDDYFRVAAFAVGFASEDAAINTNNRIKANGPKFIINHLSDVYLSKNAAWDQISTPLAQALNKNILLPFIVVLDKNKKSTTNSEDIKTTTPNTDQFSLLDPKGLDNINQELLRLLLEIMIVDTLSWILDTNTWDLKNQDCKCRVFGATRMRYQAFQQNITEIDSKYISRIKSDIVTNLKKRWNISICPDQIFWEDKRKEFGWPSLRRDSLHIVMNELLTARNKSKKGNILVNRIDTAFCQPILYEKDKRQKYWPQKTQEDLNTDNYRYLKNIADPIAKLVKIGQEVSWEILETDLNIQEDRRDLRGAAGFKKDIMRIINCHRALDESNKGNKGNLADGFGYGLAVNHTHDVAGNVVALRLQQEIPNLNGDEFMRIVNHVAENGPLYSQALRLSGGSRSNTTYVSILEKIHEKWMIREFNNEQEYRDAGVEYHRKHEYDVRKYDDNKIVVFANLLKVGQDGLDYFVWPLDEKYFSCGCTINPVGPKYRE